MSEITCTILQVFAPDLLQFGRAVFHPVAQQVRTVDIGVAGIGQDLAPVFDAVTAGETGMVQAMTGDLHLADLEGLGVLQIDKVDPGLEIVDGDRVEGRLLLGAENIG